MEPLKGLNIKQLTNTEFTQLLRDTLVDAKNTGVAILESDVPLKRYLTDVETGILPFETVTKNPQKDIYTQTLTEKDMLRDRAFRSFGRKLRTFEWSDNALELAAYQSLIILWDIHKDTPDKNVKDQSGATHNFLNDLDKEPYKSDLATLKMEKDRDKILITNNAYDEDAHNRRAALAAKGVTDTKAMRNNLSDAYRDVSEYILAMAKAYPEVTEWQTLLTNLNVTRKRYAELIARKMVAKKEEEESPQKA